MPNLFDQIEVEFAPKEPTTTLQPVAVRTRPIVEAPPPPALQLPPRVVMPEPESAAQYWSRSPIIARAPAYLSDAASLVGRGAGEVSNGFNLPIRAPIQAGQYVAETPAGQAVIQGAGEVGGQVLHDIGAGWNAAMAPVRYVGNELNRTIVQPVRELGRDLYSDVARGVDVVGNWVGRGVGNVASAAGRGVAGAGRWVQGNVIPPPLPTSARPAIQNPDGSVSTVLSIGVGDNRGEWVIPTIVNGVKVSPDEATRLWQAGRNPPLGGPFRTVEESNRFAQQFHEQEAQRVAPSQSLGAVVIMTSPKGARVEVPRDQVQRAMALGYR